MLEFKKLRTDIELQEFCNNYHEAISKKSIQGFELTLQSIKKKGKVMGVFQNGKMIAGYALSNVPYSLLANITEEKGAKNGIFEYRNCIDCGSTLMRRLFEDRDLSPEGYRRRESWRSLFSLGFSDQLFNLFHKLFIQPSNKLKFHPTIY